MPPQSRANVGLRRTSDTGKENEVFNDGVLILPLETIDATEIGQLPEVLVRRAQGG